MKDNINKFVSKQDQFIFKLLNLIDMIFNLRSDDTFPEK